MGSFYTQQLVTITITMGDASLNYFDALVRHAVCVSVHCYPLRTMHSAVFSGRFEARSAALQL